MRARRDTVRVSVKSCFAAKYPSDMMRKLFIGFVVVLVIAVGAYLRFHRPKKPIETAYAGDRQVTLWSTTAQVREPVATVNFGERLDVLERFSDQVRVRTASGVVGWTTNDELLSAEYWQKAQDLQVQVAKMPLQASGHTRVLSNLHIDPARDSPRIRQLDRGIPVELFQREAVDVPASPSASHSEEAGGGSQPDVRKEDWWLVRAHLPGQAAPPVGSGAMQPMTLSGWLLGRFVDLDIPAPLPDYASSAGMRIVAWFELNRASDAEGNPKPQYLAVGTRGPEGQPCDFKLLRVFTWDKKKNRYETAFVESDLCGKLPVQVGVPSPRGGGVPFTFEDWSKGTSEQRTYRMYENVVRRVKETGAPGSRPASVRPAKRKRAHG